MSLGKNEVVPVDTHIHSIAMTFYNKNKFNMDNYEEISTFFERLWQPFAGWAQAVRFLEQNKKNILNKILFKGGIFQ